MAEAQELEGALEDIEEKPVEIEIPGEEPEPKVDPSNDVRGASGPAPGKKRERFKETVVKLKGENRQITDAAARLFAENQKLKQDMENLSQSGMANYQRGLKAEQQLAQRALEDAITAADAPAQAKAQTDVARVTAEMRDVDAYFAQNPPKQAPKPGEQPAAQPQQQPQQHQPQTLAEPVRQWIDANSWFDPSSSDFDSDMHDEAVEFARILERRLTRQGKVTEINTPAYFKQIQDHIDTEFGEAEQEEPEERPKPRVAAVSRAAAPANGAAPSKGTKVSLTADEVSYVKKSVAEKAVRYPVDHPDPAKRGQPKQYEDALRDYAIRKQADVASQSSRRTR